MKKLRGHFRISGRVQGVCFRMYTQEQARRLGVVGWVRNLPDGDVEVLAEAEEDSLTAFLEWCRQGPSYAHVTRVQEQFSEPTGEFSEFRITY